jgi:nuclear GTP-binding protein
MGTAKKEKNRVAASGTSRMTKPTKGENFYRDAKKLKQLNMLRGSKPVRDVKGKIIKPADYQGRLASGSVARVAPDRRWFGTFLIIDRHPAISPCLLSQGTRARLDSNS